MNFQVLINYVCCLSVMLNCCVKVNLREFGFYITDSSKEEVFYEKKKCFKVTYLE